jgi:hypothetical protein
LSQTGTTCARQGCKIRPSLYRSGSQKGYGWFHTIRPCETPVHRLAQLETRSASPTVPDKNGGLLDWSLAFGGCGETLQHLRFDAIVSVGLRFYQAQCFRCSRLQELLCQNARPLKTIMRWPESEAFAGWVRRCLASSPRQSGSAARGIAGRLATTISSRG